MDATTHQPVMCDEIVDLFAPVPAGVVVDATYGRGGHAAAIVRSHPHLRVVAVDRDPAAVRAAAELRSREPALAGRLSVHHARFDQVASVLEALGVREISGALFDLGVSSPQLDDATRGFSYRHDGPLDMRMDPASPLSAGDVVNDYDEARLADVIRANSDERFARRIARAIVARRPVRSTLELAEIVTSAIPAPARRTGGHPAKRTFQALRIEVNGELDALEGAVAWALEATVPGGRVAVLAYHSGEDRIVKRVFRAAERGPAGGPASPYVHEDRPTGGIVRRLRVPKHPSEAEQAGNPRSRSARLRAVERCEPAAVVA
ncbi:MAG: 16S rRNA (cytosine(1402)-N(4))-methyltransferase RsmH [Acidimicrobiia bacterium]